MPHSTHHKADVICDGMASREQRDHCYHAQTVQTDNTDKQTDTVHRKHSTRITQASQHTHNTGTDSTNGQQKLQRFSAEISEQRLPPAQGNQFMPPQQNIPVTPFCFSGPSYGITLLNAISLFCHLGSEIDDHHRHPNINTVII